MHHSKMKKHIKVYLDFFGYGITDFIPSEISGHRAVDIHHIDCRGMGGSNESDYIENLIAVTRDEHDKFGDKKAFIEYLYSCHLRFIIDQRSNYKIRWDKIPLPFRDKLMDELK